MREAGGTIGATLDSLSEQTFSDWEAVVVDDGSDDRGPSIVEERAQQDPRVRLFRHEGGAHRGTPATRTETLRRARGELLAFLDADDLYLPHALDAFVEAFRLHPSAAVVYGQATTFGDGVGAEVIGRGVPHREASLFRQLVDSNVLVTSATAVRASALPEVPFPPRMKLSQDWALWVQIAESGRFVFLPQCLSLYRVHSKSVTMAMKRARRQTRYEVNQARFLHELLPRVGSVKQQDELRLGLQARATRALLEALSAARHGAPRSCWAWCRAAFSISRSPLTLVRALLDVPGERRRIKEKRDPRLLVETLD